MIISIINQKGGVGKTTTAVNLGAALREVGRSVLLVDMDPQRSLWIHSQHSGFEVRTCTAESLPATIEDRSVEDHAVEDRTVGYDFILIDCGPTLGAETAAALRVSQLAIAPTPPRFLDLAGLKQLMETVQAVRERGNPLLRLHILVTMTAHLVGHWEMEEQLRAAFPHSVFDTTIPRLKSFEEAATAQQSVLQYHAQGAAANSYRAVAQEILHIASLASL